MWQGGVFVLFCFLLFLHTRLQNKSGEKLDDLSAVCTPCANRVQRYPGGRGAAALLVSSVRFVVTGCVGLLSVS